MAEATPRSPLKLAYLALQKAESRVAELEREQNESIAIVGMACRIPGAADGPEGYWALLRDGVNAARPNLPERWRAAGAPAAEEPMPPLTKWAALISDPDLFDPQFFGISPREAAGMDPQQRLLLEASWEALEHAGIAPSSLYATPTGVYFGLCTSDYQQIEIGSRGMAAIDSHFASGISHSIASGRVSYVLGLQGPSITVDTACSSSLVAVHLACQGLRAGDCRVALAGGVNLIFCPEGSLTLHDAGMLALDGQCKAFDAKADGFVRGEGCGVIVLKRLSDAVTANDRILAVIRSTAANQDGPSSGLTVPNGLAQQSLLRTALASAGIEPRQIGYVETHGTGTSLGDPIEAEALGMALGHARDPAHPLLIGSVKTNIGHLEAAAGIAGLIKVVLALQHREIPRHLNWSDPSPHIRWKDLPIRVVTEHTAWRPIEGRRIAGVSSFGFSGTNVHVIVEEAPALPLRNAIAVDRPVHVLALSARTHGALHKMAGSYVDYLAAHPEAHWEDVCYTANVGRSHASHRLSVRARTAEEARVSLRALLDGETPTTILRAQTSTGHRPKIAFLFTGQGAQRVGMGKELYAVSPMFREVLDSADEILRNDLEAPLGAVVRGEHPRSEELLHETLYTQPALFAFEYALAKLWSSWGVEPAAVAGHSIGEYVAAAIAGVFSFEEGLRLVASRARLMSEIREHGVMFAVQACEPEVAAALAGFEHEVSIAAVNGPTQVVISGFRDPAQQVANRLAAAGHETKPLHVSQAFHSPVLDGITAAYQRRAAEVSFAPPRIRLLSNLTGSPIDSVSASYWVRQMRGPVRFQANIQALQKLGCDLFIEIGPKPVLTALGQATVERAGWGRWIASMRPKLSEWESLARAVQEVYASGSDIDWTAWDTGFERRRLSLPTYPFERQRHWTSSCGVPKHTSRGTSTGHPLLGSRLRTPAGGAAFEAVLQTRGVTEWIRDHKLAGRVIMPATGFIESMLAAGRQGLGPEWSELRDMAFIEPLEFPDGDERTVQILIDEPSADSARVRYFSTDQPDESNAWRLNAEAYISRTRNEAAPPEEPVDKVRQRCSEQVAGPQFYESLRARGAEFGPAFVRVESVDRRDGEVLARVRSEASDIYNFHPAVLDACIQAGACALTPGSLMYLPASIGRVRWYASPEDGCCFTHVVITRVDADVVEADVTVLNESGSILVRIEKLSLRPAGRTATPDGEIRSWFYRTEWQATELPKSNPADGSGAWLIVGGNVVAHAVGDLLWASGARVLRCRPDRIELQRIVTEAGADVSRIIYFGDERIQNLNEVHSGEMTAKVRASITGLIETFHAISRTPQMSTTRLFVVGHIAEDGPTPALASAPLIGAASAIAVEHPELRCTRIVTDSRDAIAAARAIIAEASAEPDEEFIAYRNGIRHVPRVQRSGAAEQQAVRLTPTRNGGLEGLKLEPVQRDAPGPDEIEIRVRAAALNFHDVLTAIGLLDDPDPLGTECAGVVTRVGEGVRNFKTGDSVVALAGGCFGTFVTASALLCVPKPHRLSFEEAAAQSIAYLTADYSLNVVGKLQRGQRVLVHAATGGVGLAAIHLCHRAGAEIFATAGNEQKREYLRSRGVQHVMDSRSAAFATEIMAVTGGAGVDIVLNSLAGELTAAGLSVLGPLGHFVEIGRTDVRDPQELRQTHPNVRYSVVYLADDIMRMPEVMGSRLKDLIKAIADGELPLLPQTLFTLEQSAEAFRYMAMAKHIGKVVLTSGEVGLPERAVRADGAYVVTGGLSGLGLEVGTWLARSGAGTVVLAGRRSASVEVEQRIAILEAAGATIKVVTGDVADPADAARVLAAAGDQTLRGIVHCAGVYDDAAMDSLTWERFDAVLRPKVEGAWNFHALTAGKPLDFFVLFSSWATIAGSPGQANYTAANAFLDALAHHRHSLKLPVTSINWGAWSQAGFFAGSPELQKRLTASGASSMTTGDALRALELTIRYVPGPQVAIAPVAWPEFFANYSQGHLPSIYRGMNAASADEQPAERAPALLGRLANMPQAKRQQQCLSSLQDLVATVLALPSAAQVDIDQPIRDYGMDSLIAIELRNRLASVLGKPVPATVFFDYPSVRALSHYILRAFFSEPAVAASPRSVLDLIEQMSEEEVDTILSSRAE